MSIFFLFNYFLNWSQVGSIVRVGTIRISIWEKTWTLFVDPLLFYYWQWFIRNQLSKLFNWRHQYRFSSNIIIDLCFLLLNKILGVENFLPKTFFKILIFIITWFGKSSFNFMLGTEYSFSDDNVIWYSFINHFCFSLLIVRNFSNKIFCRFLELLVIFSRKNLHDKLINNFCQKISRLQIEPNIIYHPKNRFLSFIEFREHIHKRRMWFLIIF